MTEIKICGLFRDCDIDYVNEARPGYAGFILQFPKSHRNISIPRAAELRKRLLPGIKAVGVFVNRPAEEILRAKETIGLDVIQLHGQEDVEYIRKLRELTMVPLIQAFQVEGPADLNDKGRLFSKITLQKKVALYFGMIHPKMV